MTQLPTNADTHLCASMMVHLSVNRAVCPSTERCRGLISPTGTTAPHTVLKVKARSVWGPDTPTLRIVYTHGSLPDWPTVARYLGVRTNCHGYQLRPLMHLLDDCPPQCTYVHTHTHRDIFHFLNTRYMYFLLVVLYTPVHSRLCSHTAQVHVERPSNENW